MEDVRAVADRAERHAGHSRQVTPKAHGAVNNADFEPLSNGDAHRLAAGEVEHVGRHLCPWLAALGRAGLQQSVREDHASGGLVDRDRHAGARSVQADKTRPVARVPIAPYQEGQPPEALPSDRRAVALTERVQSRVAPCRQIERLVVFHGVIPFS